MFKKSNQTQLSQKGNAFVFVAALSGVFGSLMIGGLSSLKDQQNEISIADQQSYSIKAKQLIVSFILVHGRMPCPATSRGGKESCDQQKQKGWFPVETLVGQFGDMGSGEQKALNNIRYLVYRGLDEINPDLAKLKNIYKPYIKTNSDNSEVRSNVIGLNDFCTKLNSKDLVNGQNNQFAHINASEVINNIPVALAVGTNIEFSNINLSDKPEIESPQRPNDLLYKDLVLTVSSQELLDKLECKGIISSMEVLQVSGKLIQSALKRRADRIDRFNYNAEVSIQKTFWSTVERVYAFMTDYLKSDSKIKKPIGRIQESIRSCLMGNISSCMSIPVDVALVYTGGELTISTLLKNIMTDINVFVKHIIITIYSLNAVEALKILYIWDGRSSLIDQAEKLGPFYEIEK